MQPLDDLVPGAPAGRQTHAVFRQDEVLQPDIPMCAVTDRHVLGQIDADAEGGVAGISGTRILDVACDTDFEYYVLNGSSVTNTVNDIETVMSGVEFIYERDVNITFEITVIIVRTTSSDPYSSNSIVTNHDQMTAVWSNPPESGIPHDSAQLFSGKNLDAPGLAWIGVVCFFPDFETSVVQSQFSANFDLRQAVSAHEIGHTLNALHCNGSGDCHIMCSVANSCDGTLGENLRFGANAMAQINGWVTSNGSCMGTHPAPLAPPFFDDFEGATSLNSERWTYADGALTSTGGVNEPSGVRAMELDSTGNALYSDDEARTNFIQLAGEANFAVTYYTQHVGVEAGKSLSISYRSNSQNWVPLNTIISDGIDQTQFQLHQHVLPPNAYWDEFRLRFTADGDSTTDNWFIDNVFVGPDPGIVFGACCMPDFTCNDAMVESDCVEVAGGTWQGDATSCDEGVNCLPPLGACCLPNQSCQADTTQHGCEVNGGGVWQGERTSCQPGGCSPPVGACCLNETCVEGVSSSQCASVNGAYQGDGVPCDVVECSPGKPCVADLVDAATFQPPPDGFVDAADLAYLLGEWGVNPGSLADIVDSNTFQPPPDGVVDAADLAYLLGDWGVCK